MKKYFIVLLVALFSHGYVFAQGAIEKQIRDLELLVCKAIVEQDYATLEKLWATDFMVNNPSNMVLNSRDEVFERMGEGIIHYRDFTRKTESVMVVDEKLVIVMGEETVYPIGNAPHAGETIKRRYTNIWRKIDSQWKVQARHANMICER
jgi:hypothetical protein